MGTQTPLPKKEAEAPPQFSAHFYCGQTAGCFKIPLGTKVGLSPGDFVLIWGPIPHLPKMGAGAPPQIFGPCCLLWPNDWMDQDGTWLGGRPQLMRLCVRWGPCPPPAQKRGQTLPNFRPIFIVAKRLDASRCHCVWR